MQAWHGVALFVGGVGIGIAVGRSLTSAPAPGAPAAEIQQQGANVTTDSRRTVPDAEAAIARLPARKRARAEKAAEVDAPEAGAGAAGAAPTVAAPPKLDAAARTARVNALRGEEHTWFENHDGKKALDALEELAGLVPEGRDAAMELTLAINKDVNGANTLKLPEFQFYSALGKPAIRDLMTWALENPASSPADFRVTSAWSIPWAFSSQPEETIRRFDAALAIERDSRVQDAIVSNLADMHTAEAEALLSRIFLDANRDAGLRADSAMALSGTSDPAVLRALESAAQADPDARVRSAAKLSIVTRDPPATGCLIVSTTPDGNAEAAGIKVGDILTSYNGHPVPGDADLRREIAAAGALDAVPVVVVRDGREETIKVKPGRLGITPRPVQKRP